MFATAVRMFTTLQFQKESSMSAVAIDIDDDDVTSSLNTLLDTRPDSRANSSGRQPATHPTDRLTTFLF